MISVDVNEVPLANIDRSYGGPTLGEYATGGMQFPASQAGTAAAGVSRTNGGILGHTLMWWAVGAALVVGLWALFQHVGPAEERRNFANLELSFVNVLLVSLVPLVGIPVWKAVITTLPFPTGVKTFVAAA